MGRIEALVEAIPPCDLLADVGCDHGEIGSLALERGRAKRLVATDVSAKSLEKAKKRLKGYLESGRAAAVCCDGLAGLNERPDVAVIAGMGGAEIVSILRSSPVRPAFLVLSPQKNAYGVRKYLAESGYRVLRDEAVAEGRMVYDVIAAEEGEDEPTEAELEFGRTNLLRRGEAFLGRLEREETMLLALLEGGAPSEKSRGEIAERIQRIREVKGR